MYKCVLCPYVKVPLPRHPQDSHPTLGASWQYLSVTHNAALSLYSVCSSRMNPISVLFQCHSIKLTCFNWTIELQFEAFNRVESGRGQPFRHCSRLQAFLALLRGHFPHASFQCLLLSSSLTDFHWLASCRIGTVSRQVNGTQIPPPPEWIGRLRICAFF